MASVQESPYPPGSILHILRPPIIKNKEELGSYNVRELSSLLDKKNKELTIINTNRSSRELTIKSIENDLIQLQDPDKQRVHRNPFIEEIREKNNQINKFKYDVGLDNKLITELNKMIMLIREKYRDIEPADNSWVFVGGKIRKRKTRNNKRKTRNNKRII